MIKNKYITSFSFVFLFISIVASIIFYRYFMIQKIALPTIEYYNNKIALSYKDQIINNNESILEKLNKSDYIDLLKDEEFIKFTKESLIYFNSTGLIINLYNAANKVISNSGNINIKLVKSYTDDGIYNFLWTKLDKYFLNSRTAINKQTAFYGALKGIPQNIITPKNILSNDYILDKKASFIISYIPIIYNSEIYGVIEIYSDITNQWESIESGLKKAFIAFFSILLIFFIIIMRNTSFAQKIINQQFETNRSLEDAKIKAETESTAKTEFLANVSHELRTPLNSIIGFSEMMISKNYSKISSEQYKGYTKDINNSGKHLLSVINDILDFSKASADKLKIELLELDLNKLLSSSMRFIKPRADEASISLIEDIPKTHIIIKADPKRLKQALLNLLSNSVKFTPENGSITLKINKIEETSLVEIFVIDNGIGMSEKDIPKALSSFGQIDNKLNRKYEGTGLGLPLTKKLVELMNGKFELQSQIGIGTTVILTFMYYESVEL